MATPQGFTRREARFLMCVPLRNGGGANPAASNDSNRTGTPPMRAYGFATGDTADRPNNSRPAPYLPNNFNVCGGAGKKTEATEGLWSKTPLPPPPPWLSLVALYVTNSNSIIDDAWDFKIDGETVANYDGQGEAILKFYAYLPKHREFALTAECVIEQNDNLFAVILTVDGVAQINDGIGGDGTVGDIRDFGTFNT